TQGAERRVEVGVGFRAWQGAVDASGHQPRAKAAAPGLRTLLVGGHVASDSEQPQPGVAPVGKLSAPSPGDGEGLGDYVVGIGSGSDPTTGETPKIPEGAVEKSPELRLIGAHRFH